MASRPSFARLQPLGQSHRVGHSPILESSRSSRRGWVQGWRKAVPGGPREATRWVPGWAPDRVQSWVLRAAVSNGPDTCLGGTSQRGRRMCKVSGVGTDLARARRKAGAGLSQDYGPCLRWPSEPTDGQRKQDGRAEAPWPARPSATRGCTPSPSPLPGTHCP